MNRTLLSYRGLGIGLLLGLLLSFAVYPGINPYFQTIYMVAMVNIMLATSLTLINGFSGQFSLGHAGFMAVGGYTAAALSYYVLPKFFPTGGEATVQLFFFVSTILGGLLAALCGWLVGLPSLRLKGDYLAIVTLGFGEIIRVILLNVESLGGARGFTGIKVLTNEHWMTLTAVIVSWSVFRFLGTPTGRAMLAVREDEVAAEAMGVDTTNTKVKAFVIGAFWAGITGSLYGHYYGYLNPAGFSFIKSFEIIVIIVLGGLGSVSGAILAAIGLSILPEALRPLQEITKIDFRMIIYSLVLILFMILRPDGILGRKEYFEFFRKRSKA